MDTFQHGGILSFYFMWLVTNSEVLTYTNSTPPLSNVIQCQDPNSVCIINCDSSHVCSNHTIHCHNTSQIACVINLNADYAANSSVIQTHLSPNITIYSKYQYSAKDFRLHAYERIGARLFINVTGFNSLEGGYIYGPLGHNSLLSMICGFHSCSKMRIYEDWSTTLRLKPTASGAFRYTHIRNIFDSGGLDLIRSNYGAGAQLNYRASVYILDCDGVKDAFSDFRYYGVNHGAYYVRAKGGYTFMDAMLSFTTDNRVNQSVQYPVKIYSSSFSNLRRASFTFGVGSNVFIEVDGKQGLWYSSINARDANSLTLYCRLYGGTPCSRLNIKLPQNNNPHSFEWICESPSKCYDSFENYLEIPYVYDCSYYYISSRIEARIYCGYDQTSDYCDLYPNHTFNSKGTCGSSCEFDNHSTLTSIAAEMDAFCSSDTVEIDTLQPTVITTNPSADPSASPITTIDTTKAPSNNPTQTPSNDPTQTPTNDPTKLPPSNTTISPSNNTTFYPSIADEITTIYEISIEIKTCADINDDEAICDLSSDDVSALMDAVESATNEILVAVAVVQIYGVEIVNDEVKLRLSIAQSSGNVLESADIRQHIEKEIDDMDKFGDINVEREDVDSNDTESENADNLFVLNWQNILIAIGVTVGSVILCCVFRGVCKTKPEVGVAQMIQILSIQEANKIPTTTNNETNNNETNNNETNNNVTPDINETGGNKQPVIGEEDGEEDDDGNMSAIGEKDAVIAYPNHDINIGNDDEIIMGDDETATDGALTNYI